VISCFSKDIHIRIHLISQPFSECWLVGTLQCSMGPRQLRFHPLAQTSSYAKAGTHLVYILVFNILLIFSRSLEVFR